MNVLVTISDISEDSVKTCENNRYYSDKMILRSTGRPPFDAEFIVADCCEVSFDKTDEKWMQYD